MHLPEQQIKRKANETWPVDCGPMRSWLFSDPVHRRLRDHEDAEEHERHHAEEGDPAPDAVGEPAVETVGNGLRVMTVARVMGGGRQAVLIGNPLRRGGALQQMENSELVAEALGEHVFDFVLRNKRTEWEIYRSQVTPYELKTYLSL